MTYGSVGLHALLKADERVANVTTFIADHFCENVLPLGYQRAPGPAIT
ncbi:MAG: hypothetical protein ABIM50_02510 [Novosphingobium sp.]